MDRALRGAAYHEAGHAIVGWSGRWTVVKVEISTGEGAGRTCFNHNKADPPFRNRVAVCFAGTVAQAMFNAPTNERSGTADQLMAAVLMEGLDNKTCGALVMRVNSMPRRSCVNTSRAYTASRNI
jgi:hypothetical protein